jgi:sulfur relay (sulfurtransferase) DsrF/TusC family protein
MLTGTKHTVAQLSDTNKPSHILIKDLESTTVLLRLAGLTETTWAVEDFQEGVEVN